MLTIKEKIINRGLLSNAKILMPELGDSRIQKASPRNRTIPTKDLVISVGKEASIRTRTRKKPKRLHM